MNSDEGANKASCLTNYSEGIKKYQKLFNKNKHCKTFYTAAEKASLHFNKISTGNPKFEFLILIKNWEQSIAFIKIKKMAHNVNHSLKVWRSGEIGSGG